MARNFLKSSLQNASFNIIFQILFRCVTFIMNAFVLRYVDQSVVGVMNVRLLLLESTILFLSREAFRRACLSRTEEHNWPQVINLMWLTVPICQILSLVFGYVWLKILVVPGTEITQHYTLGVWAICVSCCIESFCEPLYLLAQAFLFVRLKVIMDTVLILVRTLTFTPLVISRPQDAVIAFSVAQVSSIFVYTVGYYTYFYKYIQTRNRRTKMESKTPDLRKYARRDSLEDEFPLRSLKDIFPSKIDGYPMVDYNLVILTWSFFKQGILKQVLTEGERYVMTLFSVLSFSEQGIYDIVNNLGSLAARFIFRPIEESAYFYFSQMINRNSPIHEQDPKKMKESADVLFKLLRCITSFGLVILVFGQSYSKLLLYLYGGHNLIVGAGPVLMRSHCLAVVLLAINGITECYALATMDASFLDKYNYVMAALSVTFLFISWGLTSSFGGVGFIMANCLNMLARIVHSLKFMRGRYKATVYKPWKGIVPPSLFLLSLVICGIITLLSDILFFDTAKLWHLVIGVVNFIVVVMVWSYEERELLKLGLAKWHQKTD